MLTHLNYIFLAPTNPFVCCCVLHSWLIWWLKNVLYFIIYYIITIMSQVWIISYCLVVSDNKNTSSMFYCITECIISINKTKHKKILSYTKWSKIVKQGFVTSSVYVSVLHAIEFETAEYGPISCKLFLPHGRLKHVLVCHGPEFCISWKFEIPIKLQYQG